MRIKTALTISRISNTLREDVINIKIHDQTNGNEILSLEISDKDFAKAITGLSRVSSISEVQFLKQYRNFWRI